MGMCKKCSKVYGASEMKDGYCKECLKKGFIKKVSPDYKKEETCFLKRLALLLGAIFFIGIGFYFFNDNLIINGSDKFYILLKGFSYLFGLYILYEAIFKKCNEFNE